MLRYLLDTDHVTLYEHAHNPLRQKLATFLHGEVGVGVVTAEEALRGRLANLARARDGQARITRYGQLVGTITVLRRFPMVEFDQACENQFQQLLRLRLRIGTQDLKIAATALASNLTLVTRNRRDFSRVPGLVLEDWS